MFCKDCKGKNIKTRKNYTHGSSSKVKKTFVCVDCNSSNVETEEKSFGRRKRYK